MWRSQNIQRTTFVRKHSKEEKEEEEEEGNMYNNYPNYSNPGQQTYAPQSTQNTNGDEGSFSDSKNKKENKHETTMAHSKGKKIFANGLPNNIMEITASWLNSWGYKKNSEKCTPTFLTTTKGNDVDYKPFADVTFKKKGNGVKVKLHTYVKVPTKKVAAIGLANGGLTTAFVGSRWKSYNEEKGRLMTEFWMMLSTCAGNPVAYPASPSQPMVSPQAYQSPQVTQPLTSSNGQSSVPDTPEQKMKSNSNTTDATSTPTSPKPSHNKQIASLIKQIKKPTFLQTRSSTSSVHCDNAVMQWEFKPEVLITKDLVWNEKGHGNTKFRGCDLKALNTATAKSEAQIVEDLFHTKMGGNNWKIKHIYAIDNQALNQQFKFQVHKSATRLENDPQLFKSETWKDSPNSEWRQTIMNVYEKYCKSFEHNQDLDHVQIIPALHGTPSLDVAWKIAETGFATLGTTDDGFYGKGLYFTSSADYALHFYSKPSSDGDYVVCLTWLVLGNPYPIIENPLKDKQFVGKPAKNKHDSHFTVVRSADPNNSACPIYIPASQAEVTSPSLPLYNEYVLFQESQAFIKYILVVNKM